MSARHRSPRFLFSTKNRSKSCTDILVKRVDKIHYPLVTSVFDIDIDEVPTTPFSISKGKIANLQVVEIEATL